MPNFSSSSVQTAVLQELQNYVYQKAEALHKAQVLQKAVDTSAITSIVPEDLQPEVYNTQWDPAHPEALTTMKLLPTTPAAQIVHKYSELTAYGNDRGYGDVGERSLPLPTQPTFAQREVNIRLTASYSDVYLLASLERVLNVNGATTPEAITRDTLLRSMLWRKNRSIIFADTRAMRSGTSSTRHKGVIQLIEEGTDGTTGDASRYGSHVIDMEGAELNTTTIREKAADVITYYGFPGAFIMPPHVRARFESQLDAAMRIQAPIGRGGFIVGQNVSGMHTNGRAVLFYSDNMLDAYNSHGKYRGTADDGAPGAPTAATGTAQAYSGSTESKFRSADAGTYYYWVTEIRDGRESTARSIGSVTVAANQEVAFSVTPSDPFSDSFRLYRHTSNSATSAFMVKDYANDQSGAAVTFYDRNENRPGYHTVLGLDIASKYAEYSARVATGQVSDYATPAEQRAEFFSMPDSPQNAVSVAHLGPEYGSMVLAHLSMTKDRPLYYSAYATQVRGPKKCLVFKNVAGIGQ